MDPAGLAGITSASVYLDLTVGQPGTRGQLRQLSLGFDSRGLAFSYQRDVLNGGGRGHTYKAGLAGANSREFDSVTPHPVIDLMDEQRDVVEMGGTMRLGVYPARLKPGSTVALLYEDTLVYERHRHRYEVNPRYRRRLEDAGLVCSGTSPDDRLVEFTELADHPFWVGTQAHPEFKSRPDRPHPLFRELVGAALARAEGRRPRLLQLDQVPQAH